DVRRVVEALAAAGIRPEVIALHLHDTRGTALANVMAAMELGIRCFDASTGGTGGSADAPGPGGGRGTESCPYAPGSAGNLATEDLVYLLDREGVRTGVDLDGVLAAARFIAGHLGRDASSTL